MIARIIEWSIRWRMLVISMTLAIAANAGWYTLPVRNELFPYGLAGADVSDEVLRNVFARPVIVLLGDQDIDTQGDSLRRTPEAMRQGPHRFARGHYFYETAEQEAGQLQADFNWTLVVVPGADHDNGKMAIGAAALIR